MYELIQAGKCSYYINAPVKIGVYAANENDIYLIDSGNDKDAGRKVRKILDEKGWSLKGIINTHSNADHIGGNQYLQKQTGCMIFANGIETAFTEYPILEPSFLYGGYPFKELRHKFLMAAESKVTDVTDSTFPQELEIIDLPGHFFSMIGIKTPDNTVFLADCINSADTLNKYKVGFIYDVAKYLDTLSLVENLDADCFVPAHADATGDIGPLAALNRDAVNEVADFLLDVCKEACNFEKILHTLFSHYGLVMTPEQYVLVGSTVRSYLSWLKDKGELEICFEDNFMLWRATAL